MGYKGAVKHFRTLIKIGFKKTNPKILAREVRQKKKNGKKKKKFEKKKKNKYLGMI